MFERDGFFSEQDGSGVRSAPKYKVGLFLGGFGAEVGRRHKSGKMRETGRMTREGNKRRRFSLFIVIACRQVPARLRRSTVTPVPTVVAYACRPGSGTSPPRQVSRQQQPASLAASRLVDTRVCDEQLSPLSSVASSMQLFNRHGRISSNSLNYSPMMHFCIRERSKGSLAYVILAILINETVCYT